MHPILKEKYEILKKNKSYFLKLLDLYSTDQLKFSEDEKSWNILEVFDHIIKVESRTLQFMLDFDFSRKNEILGLEADFKSFLLNLALKSPLKFKVPVKVLLPEQKSKATLILEWEELRAKFDDFLESFPNQKIANFIFFHPRSGKLNVVQTLKFLNEHMFHHKKQLTRISNFKNFPTNT